MSLDATSGDAFADRTCTTWRRGIVARIELELGRLGHGYSSHQGRSQDSDGGEQLHFGMEKRDTKRA